MRRLLKALTACVSVAAIFAIFVYLFGAGKMRLDPTPVITSFARSIDVGILQEIAPEGEEAERILQRVLKRSSGMGDFENGSWR